MWAPPPYPRIPYLAPAGSTEDSPLPNRDAEPFFSEEVVVEEKLDGSNVMLWKLDSGAVQIAGRAGVGAQDRAGQIGPLRAWAANRGHALSALLEGNYVLYAEWLWLTHGVAYDALPEYLIGLDLWHPDTGFVDIDVRDASFADAGILGPPRLWAGILERPACLARLVSDSRWSSSSAEGVVIRRRGAADPRAAKYVAAEFRRPTDQEWRAGRPRNRTGSGAASG